MAAFQAKWDPLVLLAVVPVVLRTADPDHPEAVTGRAYDAAREPAGYADTPRADKLAARFGVPWPRLVSAVLTEEHPTQALARSNYHRVRRRLTEAQIIDALRTAAAWHGTDHISPMTYEEARLALAAVAQRRHLHGRATEPLPSAAVIRFRWSFPEAAAAAGLTITPPTRRTPLPRPEAIRLFLASCGFVPRLRHLQQFASHHGISIADHKINPHASAIEQARQQASTAGEEFPPDMGTVPADWRERIKQGSPTISEASAQHPALNRRGSTVEEVRASIRLAFDELAPGQPFSREAYRAAATAHRLPHLGVAERAAKAAGTTWARLAQEVAAERAEELRAPRRHTGRSGDREPQ